ncbi:hypothetical protein SAY87_031698 [Trapa incisa]|uniref:Ribosomal L1 domain-containing protein 1-like n=1 Tax=Trapa incisa TaxID=236973 RepID=A0AAN7QLY2_9MYRT|nr:hypothetical protein SAY87_031698 [Trapa incisa]
MASKETVEKAVGALLKWKDSKAQAEKPQLLEEDEYFYLVVTLKKMSVNVRVKPFKVPLPNGLVDSLAEICLLIDDRPKSSLTKEDVQKKIKAENIPVSKVLKLSKLRTNYKAFEAKRKLFGSYDLFLADRNILPSLPKLLGKQFLKKRKIPVGVNLKHKGWKEQIENVCRSALFFMGSGTCSVVKVGRVSMGNKEIGENVIAAIDGIVELVPRKWQNIRSLHLKMAESLALPIYQSVPDLKLKISGVNDEGEKVDGEKVKQDDARDISVEKKKASKRSRIHEVMYMDTNLDGEDDGDIEEEYGKDSDTDPVELDQTMKRAKVKEDGSKTGKKLEVSTKVKKSEDGIKKHKKDGLLVKAVAKMVDKKVKKNVTKLEKVKRIKK